MACLQIPVNPLDFFPHDVVLLVFGSMAKIMTSLNKTWYTLLSPRTLTLKAPRVRHLLSDEEHDTRVTLAFDTEGCVAAMRIVLRASSVELYTFPRRDPEKPLSPHFNPLCYLSVIVYKRGRDLRMTRCTKDLPCIDTVFEDVMCSIVDHEDGQCSIDWSEQASASADNEVHQSTRRQASPRIHIVIYETNPADPSGPYEDPIRVCVDHRIAALMCARGT